ncbi:hypothetical protein [Streptomyces abikoensis]|uniref:hypothetical protein n=1 Tax=Streptomyces abikoensis TaxID=97398 RepID=UPI0036B48A02
MNIRRSAAAAAATLMLGGGLAIAAPAANAETWHRQWGPVEISAAYLRTHDHQWVSSGHNQPGGTTMARAAITCDKGKMTVKVRNMSSGKSDTTNATCHGSKRPSYATVAARPGDQIKFILTGSKATQIAAWAG